MTYPRREKGQMDARPKKKKHFNGIQKVRLLYVFPLFVFFVDKCVWETRLHLSLSWTETLHHSHCHCWVTWVPLHCLESSCERAHHVLTEEAGPRNHVKRHFL